uniref:Uncharacterized protein n=1 Tax=Amphimedon queenslandica TaxID=400682 RepID=A0A1X7VSF3_AMPQE
MSIPETSGSGDTYWKEPVEAEVAMVLKAGADEREGLGVAAKVGGASEEEREGGEEVVGGVTSTGGSEKSQWTPYWIQGQRAINYFSL